jgi:hypothetical protein
VVEVSGHFANQGKSVPIQVLFDLVDALVGTDEVPRPVTRPNLRYTKARVLEEQLNEMAAAYRSGATLLELGEKYQLNAQTISRHFKKAGVAVRYRVLDESQFDEVVQMYAGGSSLREVGRWYGVDHRVVRAVLIRAGVDIRDSHGG